MKKKRMINRATVKKALMTEPLQQGRWIRTNMKPSSIEYEDAILQETKHLPAKEVVCSVCAIGAVIRYVNSRTVQEVRYKAIALDLYNDHWHGLSNYFESGEFRYASFTKKQRLKLCKFVDKHFPGRVEV